MTTVATDAPGGFPVLRARGTPRELGRAMGEAFREAVRGKILTSSLCASARAERDRDPAAAAWYNAALRATLERAPEAFDELRGLAEGAHLPLDEVFLYNACCDGPLAGPPPFGPQRCTTVLTADWQLVHNEDGLVEDAAWSFLLEAEPAGGPAFTAFVYAGLLPGHAFGWNAAGLVVCTNTVQPGIVGLGLPHQVVARRVLAARSLDEAEAVVRDETHAYGYHHLVLEHAARRGVTLEFAPDGVASAPVTVPFTHTNHYRLPPHAGREATLSPSTVARLAVVEARLERGGEAAEGAAFTRQLRGGEPDSGEVFRRGTGPEDSLTLATATFDLAAREVRVLRGGVDRAHEQRFALA